MSDTNKNTNSKKQQNTFMAKDFDGKSLSEIITNYGKKYPFAIISPGTPEFHDIYKMAVLGRVQAIHVVVSHLEKFMSVASKEIAEIRKNAKTEEELVKSLKDISLIMTNVIRDITDDLKVGAKSAMAELDSQSPLPKN